MTTGTRIDPDAIYDDDAIYASLGISPRTLARARREGRLRHVRTGCQILYAGQWVLDWLHGKAMTREAALVS